MKIETSLLRSWWSARSRRERAMLWLLAGLLALFTAWYGLISPLRLAAQRAETHHARAAQNLADVEAATKIAKRSQEAGIGSGAGGLETMIAQSAHDAGVAIDGIEPTDAGVTVSIGGTSSPAFFGWVQTLQRDYGVLATDVAIKRTAPGALQVDVAFARAGQ